MSYKILISLCLAVTLIGCGASTPLAPTLAPPTTAPTVPAPSPTQSAAITPVPTTTATRVPPTPTTRPTATELPPTPTPTVAPPITKYEDLIGFWKKPAGLFDHYLHFNPNKTIDIYQSAQAVTTGAIGYTIPFDGQPVPEGGFLLKVVNRAGGTCTEKYVGSYLLTGTVDRFIMRDMGSDPCTGRADFFEGPWTRSPKPQS